MYVTHTQEVQGPPLYLLWLLASGSLKLSMRKRATELTIQAVKHRVKIGEGRLERKEFHCKRVGEWKNHIIIG